MASQQPLLSPEEIAALTAAAEREAPPAESVGQNTSFPIRKHDLASEDSSLGLNVGSLDMINERFIRMFRLGMLEVLRTSPRLNPARVEILRFGTYLKGLKPPMSVNTVRMAPLRGQSIVIIEPSVIFSSLDNFFGGFGRGVSQLTPGRLFTPTETRIINLILEVFFRSMRDAWGPICPVDFEHIGSEINPQFAQIADESDLVVLSRFEGEPSSEHAGGFIDLVIPYVSLKPVRDQLRSRVQSSVGHDESDKVWRRELAHAVNDASLEIQITMGRIQMGLPSLHEIKPGDILFFRKPEYARALIRETPVFDVEVGTSGAQVAFRIVKAVKPEPQ